MLTDVFFDIQSFTGSAPAGPEQQFNAVARLNSLHPIFDGHFPGNPVVPGVCQVQMIKELVEKALKHHTRLYESDNIKFLSMINPQATPLLEFDIRIRSIADNQYAVNAVIGSGASVFLKFKGKFELDSPCRKN